MSYTIRRIGKYDIPQFAKLLADYIQETYGAAWGGTPAQLEQDIIDTNLAVFVAETFEQKIVAFIAWIGTYDLHHCMKGGEIIDFYVCPIHRGRGAAVFLITNLAAAVQNTGGKFLKGGAVDNSVVRRLYNRVAICLPNGDCYISGRAFRHLADLALKPLREIVTNLPLTEWNREP